MFGRFSRGESVRQCDNDTFTGPVLINWEQLEDVIRISRSCGIMEDKNKITAPAAELNWIEITLVDMNGDGSYQHDVVVALRFFVSTYIAQ